MIYYPVTQAGGKPDRRYTLQKEWSGQDRQHWVVRFCGGWVGSSSSFTKAASLAWEHNVARMRAMIEEASK